MIFFSILIDLALGMVAFLLCRRFFGIDRQFPRTFAWGLLGSISFVFLVFALPILIAFFLPVVVVSGFGTFYFYGPEVQEGDKDFRLAFWTLVPISYICTMGSIIPAFVGLSAGSPQAFSGPLLLTGLLSPNLAAFLVWHYENYLIRKST